MDSKPLSSISPGITTTPPAGPQHSSPTGTVAKTPSTSVGGTQALQSSSSAPTDSFAVQQRAVAPGEQGPATLGALQPGTAGGPQTTRSGAARVADAAGAHTTPQSVETSVRELAASAAVLADLLTYVQGSVRGAPIDPGHLAGTLSASASIARNLAEGASPLPAPAAREAGARTPSTMVPVAAPQPYVVT